jgi:hypothetical protein
METIIKIVLAAALTVFISWVAKRHGKATGKKEDVKNAVRIYLPYSWEDKIFGMVFAIIAILAWTFAAWVFVKIGFSWKQLIACVAITLFGVYMLIHHFFEHEISVPIGKEPLAEVAASLKARADRISALFTMPFMATYLLDKNQAALGITWNTELMEICVLFVSLIVWGAMRIIYSKRLAFDLD